ncbi:FAD-dependent monooxygenase [Arhodomonas sp. AD133]|uniref:FAD-dependent monooxygenase n=1 Tax=Arhodomonas sp. AD133 TaxID=3415009 RepID=UPI003EB6C4B4
MDTEVVIIGGGPCGLMASLLLERQGVPNVLLEKHPHITAYPKAMGITRRTAEIYRQLGLLAERREAALPAEVDAVQIWLTSLVGEELGRSPAVEPADAPTPCTRFHCPQTHTESVLRAAVAAAPLSDIRFGARVTEVAETGEGVTATVVNRECGASNELRARWLNAADGAASRMRERFGIATHGPGDRDHFLNVYFRADYGPHLAGRRSILYSLLKENATSSSSR